MDNEMLETFDDAAMDHVSGGAGGQLAAVRMALMQVGPTMVANTLKAFGDGVQAFYTSLSNSLKGQG